jgi:hypothetical protein
MVEPSGDQLTWPPRSKPGALVHVLDWENFVTETKQSWWATLPTRWM